MFKLVDLPYAYDALAPAMSEDTLRTHHDKHHAKYVETTNQLIAHARTGLTPLEDLVRSEALKPERKLFNNAAQAWNHAFFWECMAPRSTGPEHALIEAINRDFGGVDQLKTQFIREGGDHFASGWVWIVVRESRLSVVSTHDGDTVITDPSAIPILVCDLWEHAYYLDYKNDRARFLEQWWDRLANWRFAELQFGAAVDGRQPYRYPPPLAAAA